MAHGLMQFNLLSRSQQEHGDSCLDDSSAPSLQIMSKDTISSAILSDGDDLQDYKHHKRNLLFASSGKFAADQSDDALLISAEENYPRGNGVVAGVALRGN